MFTEIRAGVRGDATYVIGLGNKGESIQFNSGYKLAPSVKAKAETLIKEITDGTLVVPCSNGGPSDHGRDSDGHDHRRNRRHRCSG